MSCCRNLISVITVVYNDVLNIEKTILSVLNQSYNEFEYIIIDGGSTDGTTEVIRKYESKLKVFISEPDNGIYDAMNKGVNYVTGAFLCFMNSGDIFYDFDVFKKFTLSSKFGDVNYGKTKMIIKDKLIDSKTNMKYINKHMPFCHQSVFVKTDLVKKFEFESKYKYSADYCQIYTLYVHDMIFNELDFYVSIYDAQTGLTSNREVDVLKQCQTIRNNIHRKYSVKSNIIDFIIAKINIYKAVVKNIIIQL